MTISGPKQIWRVANILASKAEFEPVDTTSDPWLYASTQSPEHKASLERWLELHGSADTSGVYVVRGSHQVVHQPWLNVVNHPEKYFGGEDVRIIGEDFDWIIDYRKEQIIRYGRLKSSTSGWRERLAERSRSSR